MQPLNACRGAYGSHLIKSSTLACRREEDKRKRAEEARQYQEADWVSATPQEDDFWEGDENGADQDQLQDPLYCVACDRSFKSRGALDSHERWTFWHPFQALI